MDIHADRLLILDFGSQYTQLIARRVREHGVYSEILPCDVDPARITDFSPKGVGCREALSQRPMQQVGQSPKRYMT